MAHFAEIDLNNVVVRILVVPDEQENRGNDFLSIDLGLGGRWIQTSYNNNVRSVYAGIGYTYNDELDIFISPKPYPSWILNRETGYWVSPVEIPNVPNKTISWDEENQEWIVSDPILPE